MLNFLSFYWFLSVLLLFIQFVVHFAEYYVIFAFSSKSFCACIHHLGRNCYGRIQQIIMETRMSGRKKFFVTFKKHAILQLENNRMFKYHLILKKRCNARVFAVSVSDINHKCIFFSLSCFPLVGRQEEFMVAKQLLLHISDPELVGLLM